MATTIQTKPLEFQVAHTCPTCGQVIPEPVITHEPPEVIINGTPQEIISISKIHRGKEGGRYHRVVPVVCVVARE